MRRLRFSLAVALATLLALLASGATLAHARLLRSNPEDGAVLDESPRDVYLWFDEPVAVELSSIDAFDADGRPIASAALRGDPSDPTLVIASLPDLPDGVYSLAWKILSNTDSHFTRGTLVFGVGGQIGPAAPASGQIEAPIPAPEVALRTLIYAALFAAIGSLVVAGILLRRGLADDSARHAVDAARARVWRLGYGAAILMLLAGAGWLAWQAAAIGRGPLDGLLATRFGGLWLAREGLTIVLLAAMIAARRGRALGWLAAALTLILLALVQALNSHAAGLPERAALAVAADALHLLAAGAWVGSMMALLAGLLPLLRSHRAELAQIALGGWRRFGVVAALSVGTLAATGLYSAARQVASIDAWIGTRYGLLLAGKVGLFLGVGLIGLVNSMLLHPRLAAWVGARLRRSPGWRPAGMRRLPALLLAEAGLAAIIFVASSAITAAPPARGPEFAPPRPAENIPSTLTLTADDLLVALSIRPNKPGPNIVSVDVLNTRRPPPAEILRVLVRLAYRDRDLGMQTLIVEPEDADTYRLRTDALSLAGAWQAQVAVRRKGMEDSVADFDWQVESLAPSALPRPVVVSNAPIEPTLTVLAVGLAVCTVLAAVGFAGQARAGHSQPAQTSLTQP